MAGIGFELKKLFAQKGYFGKIKAYLYTALVIIGPTILCVTMITAMQLFLVYIGVGLMERELFLAAVTYSFIFSSIITCGFSMVITRYLSDKIFNKEYDEILPSYYGLLTLCLIIGGIIGGIFYLLSPLEASFKLFAYTLFMELIIIWVQSEYLSALKDYMRIVRTFALGIAITLICTYIFIKFLNFGGALGCIVAMNIGFFIIVLDFMLHIRKFLASDKKGYFKFLAYFDKFPALFFIGLFYTVGIYVHNFIFWLSDFRICAGGTYIFCPFYDVPSFYALLSISTAMVIFVATVETEFYEKYRDYYSAILGSGTLDDIVRTKKEMNKVLVQEITYTMELQLFFSIIFMVAGMRLLPRIGFTGAAIDIFNILVLGSYGCIIMFIIMLMLLYFDDRKGALFVSSVFLLTNIVFTVITLKLGEVYYGFGFFISTILTLILSLVRLAIFIKNIDYYTFCSQPLIYKEKKHFFTKAAEILEKAFMTNQ